MIQTEDLNVTGVNPLTAPKFIKAEHPITDKASETVFKFRKQIKDVLDEKDSRQLVIVGPCSIHHADIALDYADKLTKLIPEVEDKLLKLYARRMKLNLKELRSDIHMISLLRNLRILGNWVKLYNGGKPKYLKVFRKNTWAQIFKHVEYLRLWDLREIFMEIYNKTS